MSETGGLDSIQYSISSLFLISLFLMLGFVGLGHKVLAFWMFVNSIQLVLHVPLLAIPIPANMHYFLAQYLDIARLQVSLLNQYLIKNNIITINEPQTNSLLAFCGYSETSLISNLSLILAILALICALTLLLQIIDCLTCRKKERRLAPALCNTGFRFFSLFMFEVVICTLIYFSQSTSEN